MRASAVAVATVLFVANLSSASAADYVFVAPPRDAGGSEADVYQPVADYLSAVTGKKITYRFPQNYVVYQAEMQQGKYDVVFDGPHFIAWRVAMRQHEPLARLPGKLAFVVIVHKDNEAIKDVKDLKGRTVCGFAPPNLATLTLYDQFDNPMRQPVVREVKSFKEAYDGVLGGKCVAAVLRDNAYARFDKETGNVTRVIFRSEGFANQGFTAGPRFSAEERRKMAQALLAPEAQRKMKAFFERYNKDKQLMPTTATEFQGLARLLKDTRGFEVAAMKTAGR